MREWMVVVCVTALLVVPLAGTQEQPQTQPATPTLRIGVTAVEVDAVVTDRDGRHVPDLKASDFELLQDGKPQTITSFRFVPGRPRPSPEATTTTAPAPSAVPLTTGAHLQQGHTGRIMAIVIDDLGSSSFASLARVRKALDTFIDRDVRPDDAVAVVTTAHGVGRLQQFTNDKAALKEMVARVQVSMLGIGDTSDLDQDASDLEKASAESIDETMQAGTLAAVQNVIRGMRELPGRKSVVFVTGGFSLIGNEGRFMTVRPVLMEQFERLVDESNRSFVTINTIDMRGLVNPLMNSRTPDMGFNPESRNAPKASDVSAMIQSYQHTQDGPMSLSQMGGGLHFGGNDVVRGFERALNDLEGYYILGYQPDSSTFRKSKNDAVEFHKIKVKVKRSGLQVRSRSGFFGVADDETNPTPVTPEQQLLKAGASPFTANDLGVRVTPIFGHTKNGDLFRLLLHIDGQGLTFTKSDDGQFRAPVELLAMLVDGRGAMVEAKMFRFSLRTEQQPDAAMLEAGFAGRVDIPASKPGAFQLRVAARDVTSRRTGTGYQFVRVPNVSKQRLSLSGVALRGDDASGNVALRRFHPASTLRFAFDTYNAQLDAANHHPLLTLRVRLYRDGALLLDSTPSPLDAKPVDEDPERSASVAGELKLSPSIEPGEYQMQLEVTDTLAKGAAAKAHQWIDFSIAGTP